MPWMNMTCGKCGHEADIDLWTETPIAGRLPHGVYQCPKCHFAFERRQAPGKTYPNGFYLPGEVTLVAVAARL